MDRTKNLLDKISSFPPSSAEACVLVSQPASETLPPESLSVDAVNSLDSIRTTSDMEKLLDEAERAIDSDDEMRTFSRDPYVATPATGLADFRSWKKRSIEEILETIHGYQSHSDEANETVENEAVVDIASELELDVNNFCCPSAPEPVRAIEQPAPIRYAFDWDTETGEDSVSQSNHSVEANGHPTADTAEDCFLAQDGDTIYIDGNDGFGFIDLTNFDRAQASFQANQILLECEDGTHFLIDYRNIPIAVFAGGEEIELSANEIVSPSQTNQET